MVYSFVPTVAHSVLGDSGAFVVGAVVVVVVWLDGV